jgi:hypothetical protein
MVLLLCAGVVICWAEMEACRKMHKDGINLQKDVERWKTMR